MILADKIMNERKKNGWSQEELAEQLNVSRQSVSKWESAQSTPDLQKIIQMAQIFGVSTDYLLIEDMEERPITEIREEVISNNHIRKVSLEDANAYLDTVRETHPKNAIATALCIISPVFLIFFAGLSETNIGNISEGFAAGVGLLFLFAMISIAVTIFILTGKKEEAFKYLKEEPFETEYGVTGMVKEELASTEAAYTVTLITGVILCICCPIPLIIAGLAEASDFICIAMTCILLLMVACAVCLFIIGGSVHSACKVLLQEGEFTVKEKKNKKGVDAITSAYWCLAVAIYLGWSFVTKNWGFTWIVFPVAGVAFGALKAIFKAFRENKAYV